MNAAAGTLTPVFLRECEEYHEYVGRGYAGTLCLPEYESNDAGEVFIQRGEVFCRVRSCEHQRVPMSSTSNLRAHLLRHGLQCQVTPAGRVTQAKKTAAIQWYAAVIRASGSTSDNDEDEDERETLISEQENDE